MYTIIRGIKVENHLTLQVTTQDLIVDGSECLKDFNKCFFPVTKKPNDVFRQCAISRVPILVRKSTIDESKELKLTELVIPAGSPVHFWNSDFSSKNDLDSKQTFNAYVHDHPNSKDIVRRSWYNSNFLYTKGQMVQSRGYSKGYSNGYLNGYEWRNAMESYYESMMPHGISFHFTEEACPHMRKKDEIA